MSADTGGYVRNIESIGIEDRKTIVRLSNCIEILNRLGRQIYDTSIMQLYDISMDFEIQELIQPKTIRILAKQLQQQQRATNGSGGVYQPHDMQEE